MYFGGYMLLPVCHILLAFSAPRDEGVGLLYTKEIVDTQLIKDTVDQGNTQKI